MTTETPLIDAFPSQHFTAPSSFDPRSIGIKAAGLGSLPAVLVPPFIVIAPQPAPRYGIDQLAPGWLEVLLTSTSALREASSALINPAGRIMVRSSGIHEGFTDRGRLLTMDSAASFENLEVTVHETWQRNSLISEFADPSAYSLPLILQRKLDAVRFGHVSNERRVSERHDSWLVEVFDSTGSYLRHHRITRAKRAIDSGESLQCRDEGDLPGVLRDLVSRKHGRTGRRHYEWVWDGTVVWVVQCDYEDTPRGTQPGSQWTAPSVSQVTGLEMLKRDSDATGAWPKVRCLETFRGAGLPTGQVYVLEDREALSALVEGRAIDGLRTDIANLAQAPVVVRTDIAGERPDLLLPRTQTCMSADTILQFLIETARRFAELGVEPDRFAFLSHRFIPARSGSYSYARPGMARVRIDATWGVPDSLLYFPHDSFEVDVGRGEVTWQKIRCKESYIDFAEDGRWFEKPAGTKWDWSPALSAVDLLEIGAHASTVANELNDSVEVMHFVDVRPDTGLPRCLPWFCRRAEVASVPREYVARLPRSHRLVRKPSDLAALRKEIEGTTQGKRAFRLQPDAEHLHDNRFVEAVRDLALSCSLTVELEGSVLSHVYYLLRKAGVHVVAVDHEEPDNVREARTFEKLVRDAIPDQIERGGERALVRRASRDDLVVLLRRKLVEEALELYSARSLGDLADEAADVFEVLRALSSAAGVDVNDVISRADAKRSKRGAFEEGYVLRGTWVLPAVGTGRSASLFQIEADYEGMRRLQRMNRTLVSTRQVGSKRNLELRVPRVPPEEARIQIHDLRPAGIDGSLRLTQGDLEIVIEIGTNPMAEAHANQLSLFEPPAEVGLL